MLNIKENFKLSILYITGILFVLSIFTTKKILVFSSLCFIVSIIVCISNIFKKNNLTLLYLNNTLDNNIENNIKNKKYLKVSLYSAIYPIIIISIFISSVYMITFFFS